MTSLRDEKTSKNRDISTFGTLIRLIGLFITPRILKIGMSGELPPIPVSGPEECGAVYSVMINDGLWPIYTIRLQYTAVL